MRRFGLLCLAPLALVLGAGASFACPAKGTIFQDSFADQSGGWEADTSMAFGASGLTWTLPAANISDQELNATFFNKDGDYCADAAFPSSIPNVAYEGVIFWAADYNNYYLFQVSSAGHAQIYRKVSGNWITVLDKANAAVKTGPGAMNEIRVVASGNLITTYVNGQKADTVRGQATNAASPRFGLYVQIDTAVQAAPGRTFTIKDYTVNPAS